MFIPVAFMGGLVGRFLKSFGLTVAFAIAISMIVSFSLTPMLSARWLLQTDPNASKPFLERVVDVARTHHGIHAPSRGSVLLGGVVVAGRSSEDEALPERRTTRRRSRGRFGGFTASPEVARHALRVRDHPSRRIRPSHRGHASTSNPNVRRNRPHRRRANPRQSNAHSR